MVKPDAIVHYRDVTRLIGFKDEAAGTNYQHPVICPRDIVEFPRNQRHTHTTTTKPEKVTCGECLDMMEVSDGKSCTD